MKCYFFSKCRAPEIEYMKTLHLSNLNKWQKSINLLKAVVISTDQVLIEITL